MNGLDVSKEAREFRRKKLNEIISKLEKSIEITDIEIGILKVWAETYK